MCIPICLLFHNLFAKRQSIKKSHYYDIHLDFYSIHHDYIFERSIHYYIIRNILFFLQSIPNMLRYMYITVVTNLNNFTFLKHPLSTVLRIQVYSLSLVVTLKGTVSRDFLLLVFFINQFTPSPRVSK